MLWFSGNIIVFELGVYWFFVVLDDGLWIYIDGELFVNYDGFYGMFEKSGVIDFVVGKYLLIVIYFDNGGGDGFNVVW